MGYEFYLFENDENRTDLLELNDEFEECNFDETKTIREYDREK